MAKILSTFERQTHYKSQIKDEISNQQRTLKVGIPKTHQKMGRTCEKTVGNRKKPQMTLAHTDLLREKRMQITTALEYHFPAIRLTKIQKSDNCSVGTVWGNRHSLSIAGEKAKWYNPLWR